MDENTPEPEPAAVTRAGAGCPAPAAYCLAFPPGFLAVLLAVLAVFAVDLTNNLSPPHGNYLQARCPHGVPPWWPGRLPLRDSGPPNGFEDRG